MPKEAARKPKITDRLAHTTLADVGASLSRVVYRIARQHAIAEVAKEVGSRVATINSIAEAKAYEQVGGTEIASYLNSQWSEQPKANLQILASLYETHPWVNICTSYIADALAGVPLRIWRAVGFENGAEVLEPADDSPVGRMFRWINPYQSPGEFTCSLASWMLLCGEGYIAYTRPGPGTPQGIPADMYVLFTPFVEKVVSPRMGLVGYKYSVGGEVAYFDAADVVCMQTFSPAGRFRGQGAPTAGYKTIVSDQEMRDFNRNVMQQGVHLSGVLETSEDIGKDEANVVRQSFEQQYAGSAKAAKIAVLWGGLKFSPQTILQKDIMMAEQVTANRDEIIALFGLKPELLTEKFANKATAETVRRMAFEDTIYGRWGRKMESSLSSTGLVRFDPNLRARFDVSGVPALQTSLTERITAGEIAVSSGQMTINEVRKNLLSLEPIDGPEGDVLLIQGRPVANLLNDSGPDDGPAKGTAAAALMTAAERKFSTDDMKALPGMDAFNRLKSRAFAKLEATVRAVLRELQTEARTITSRSTVRSEVLAEVEQVFLFNGRKVIVARTSAVLREFIDEAVNLELRNMATAGVVGMFDVKPLKAMARLGAQEQRIRDMMGRNWTDLRQSLADGMAAGESTDKLSARVSKFFDGMRGNAETIARTEINPAINGATVDVAIAARKAGADVVSIWWTAEDEQVRTPPKSEFNHRQAHGLTIVPGEELFVISGERMEYPGDSWNGASAGNTINCRCGVRNEVRRINASDNRGEL